MATPVFCFKYSTNGVILRLISSDEYRGNIESWYVSLANAGSETIKIITVDNTCSGNISLSPIRLGINGRFFEAGLWPL
jgi:hypothetical protein